MPDHVTELGECWHDESRQHQLRPFQPVDVGVMHVQGACDIGEHRGVVPLQHTTGELNKRKIANDARESAEGDGAGHGAPSLRFG